jgi:hypothetical protein
MEHRVTLGKNETQERQEKQIKEEYLPMMKLEAVCFYTDLVSTRL